MDTLINNNMQNNFGNKNYLYGIKCMKIYNERIIVHVFPIWAAAEYEIDINLNFG